MTNEMVIRIAARGDGVTARGRHVAGGVPGDVLEADGTLLPGPNRATPPCPHFGVCGGCQLQHANEAMLVDFVRDRVVNAAARQGLVAEVVAPVVLSPPQARRRATLHAARHNGRVVLGFREEGTHRIIDLSQCPVLHPMLAAVIAPLRRMLAQALARGGIDIMLTHIDQGIDMLIRGPGAEQLIDGLAASEAWGSFARAQRLARLSFAPDDAPATLWEPEPATITLSGVVVALPPGAFLQPTIDGEAALVDAARTWLAGAGAVADLFAGLGTFAFALAGAGARVLAVEADQAAHAACKAAAGARQRPIAALHRDLYRNPLLPDELDRFDAVLLDPPRAGAREQVARLSHSRVKKIVSISCNPASWARDTATLVAAGWRLAELRPIGQFRWSTHVELASLLLREG